MADSFRKLFNLYPGESRKAGLIAALGFLWGIGGWGSLTLSEGMFLEHIGAHSLALSYFAVAVVLCFLSSFFIFLLNRVTLSKIFTFTLLVSAFFLITNSTLLFTTTLGHLPGFWFCYKIIGWIIPISNVICFWAFIDQYYDLQDGKRFFCLFNSILFLSDATGGVIITCCLKSLGVSGILLIFASTMLLSVPFVFLITKKLKPVLEEHVETIDTVSSVPIRTILQTIFTSRFTLFLLLSYFFMEVLAVVTEYTYMQSFENYFSHENELTEFFGKCSIWVSLGNMVFGIFCYSRFVKRIGVNNIILVAPSFFFLFFCLYAAKEALPIALIGLIAREGMSYSFDDNNFNLLLAGVPTKIKNQIRIAVDSFIEPIGMLFSACLLFCLQSKNTTLGIVLSLVALSIMLFLRTNYPKAILNNLVANTIRFEKKAVDWIRQFSQKEAEFLLLSQLKRCDETGQLLAFEYLLKIKSLRLLPHLLNHMSLFSLRGKLKAIDLLCESSWAKEPVVLERLERWRRFLPHPAIRSTIQFYFARHGVLRPERIIHDLHNKHLGLLGAAILTIKTNVYAPSFLPLASQKLDLLLASKDEKEICMGLKILGLEKKPENFGQIIPYLCHPSTQVCRQAAQSLCLLPASLYRTKPTDPRAASNKDHENKDLPPITHPDWQKHVSTIISFLPQIRDPEVRNRCLLALESLATIDVLKSLLLSTVHFRPAERKHVERIVLNMGQATSPFLLTFMQNKNIHDRCRLLAGKILGKLDLQLLRKNLYTIVQAEIKRAYFYFYHAKQVQDQLPEQDHAVLTDSLMTSYSSIIDFVIQLLGIANSIEESEVLTFSLRSHNRKIRAHAFETLEKSCDTRTFALLEPLISDHKSDEKIRRYLKDGGVSYNLPQLLDIMSSSPSVADQIVSIAIKTRLNTPDWKETLHKKLKGSDPIFHFFAHELLEEVR